MIAIPAARCMLPLVGFENVKPGDVPLAYLGKLEVTNAEYRKFVEDGGYRRRDLWKSRSWAASLRTGDGALSRSHRPARPLDLERRRLSRGQADFPVTGVSWYEAVAYANWAGKSLPTIYHWSRAATTGRRPTSCREATLARGPARRDERRRLGLRPPRHGRQRQGVGLERAERKPLHPRRRLRRTAVHVQRPRRAATFRAPRQLRSALRNTRSPCPGAPRKIEQPMRDYTRSAPRAKKLPPLRRLYGYDKTPLDARTESVAEPTLAHGAGSASRRLIAARGWRRSSSRRRTSPAMADGDLFPGSNALHVRSSNDPTAIYLHAYSFLIKSGARCSIPSTRAL